MSPREKKAPLIRKWFMKRGYATNRDVINKFNYNHGISDIVCNMRASGHTIKNLWVVKKDQPRYVIYQFYDKPSRKSGGKYVR